VDDSPSRMRRALRSVHRRPFVSLGIVGLSGLLLLNVLAYAHAGAMTSFAREGAAPGRIETLSRAQKARALLLGVTVPRPFNQRTPADLELEYQALTCTARDGTSLETWHVPIEPSRGTVVLFHGYAASKAALLPEARELHALGFACLLVDFRGSGGSAGNETTLGFHEAQDVAAAAQLARSLAPGRPLVLLASSMGAAAVLRAIHTEGVLPDGLVLEAPFDRLLTTVENRFDRMGAPSFPAAHLLLFWGGVQRRIDGYSHDPVAYARAVTCPTLLLHGDADPNVTVPQARSVFEALATTDKAFVLLPGVAHEDYLAARPDEWRAAMRRFLRRWSDPHRE